MGSRRLPGKVLAQLGGVPLIELLLHRLARSREIGATVVAIPGDHGNEPLARFLHDRGHDVYAGSETDVLDRYYQAARSRGADVVVRVTGDCPLVDPAIVDEVIAAFRRSGAEYGSNTNPPTFPDGLDVEVFSFAALERAWHEAREPRDREHVTPYIVRSEGDRRVSVRHSTDLSGRRWTVDEPEDLAVLDRVVEHFGGRRDFSWLEVLALEEEHPDWFSGNAALPRNEGSATGSGQKLWRRAKRVIPGGNMLLSKRPEMFLPDRWPAYFSRASGCRVWDLDHREYLDVSLMGVGTNILGYGHPTVDDAVRKVVDSGNMSTLNCPDEVHLAERLLEMHPWAEMARFARSGGEANAIAVRIGRAASGREQVAVCGYHGWHDWYLAANLGDENGLAGHLLPGLEPRGVPPELTGTVHPFHYNRLDELEALLDSYPAIGVVTMEVSRSEAPAPGFLEGVRKLASERGAVLVFDECTSGFRETFGGLHLKYGVEPDIAVFGKALGNGYAVTAVIGRRPVMEAAQSTFISSTFWTERIGPAAALATLDTMAELRSWEAITATGLQIREGWRRLASERGLALDTWGLPALGGFTIPGPNALAYKTLVTQEMLRAGFLAGNSVYVSTAHDAEVLERYFRELARVFDLIADCEGGRDVMSLLDGPVCHSGFSRLA
jgi:glutamate-1-semialdehyde 2,1-aminomutase